MYKLFIIIDLSDNQNIEYYKNTIDDFSKELNNINLVDVSYILNKKSKPVIRALKSNLTDQINDSGQMDMSALMNIKDLYFDGDMEAAPALSGQSIGLINEVKSVKQIVNEIINEFNNTCESLGNIRF